MIKAAGILFQTLDGRVLLCERDDGLGWAFPGGKLEGAESAEEAAVRECIEELGVCPKGERVVFMRTVKDDVDYTTFLQRIPEPFKPTKLEEHLACKWVSLEEALGAESEAKADAESEELDKHWVTMQHSPVLIEGGKIVGGAGGKFTGQESTKYRGASSETPTAEAAPEKPKFKSPAEEEGYNHFLSKGSTRNPYNRQSLRKDPEYRAKWLDFGAGVSRAMRELRADPKMARPQEKTEQQQATENSREGAVSARAQPTKEAEHRAQKAFVSKGETEAQWHRNAGWRITERLASIFERRYSVRVTQDWRTSAHYSPYSDAIHMDMGPRSADGAATWRHEYAHAVDFNNSTQRFRSANAARQMVEDERAFSSLPPSEHKKLLDVPSKSRQEQSEKRQLFDFVGALTLNKVGKGHSLEYYKQQGNRQAEMFAQYFSLTNGPNGDFYYDRLHKIAPNVCAKFEEIIDDYASGIR